MPAINGFGLQVSAQRLDDLDRLALLAATHGTGSVHALDLGCGEGVVSGLLAQSGATVVALDRQDYATSVLKHASVCGQVAGTVRFMHMVLPLGFANWLASGPRWSVVYSQRMLHYLRWEEALEVLSSLRHHGAGGRGLFLGVSGVASEL